MAVYREGFIALEKIQKSSVRIFNDACDWGSPVNKGDSIWNYAKQLAEWYGDKETRKVNRYSTGTSVDIEVTLIDEWSVSDERKTIKEATEKYLLSFVTCNKGQCHGKQGYITINKI
jgi:hypothetical protein